MKSIDIHTAKSIVTCPACDGKCVFRREELVNYHKGEYDSWTEKCSQCEGRGIVLRIEYFARIKYDDISGKQLSRIVDLPYETYPLGNTKLSEIYTDLRE